MKSHSIVILNLTLICCFCGFAHTCFRNEAKSKKLAVSFSRKYVQVMIERSSLLNIRIESNERIIISLYSRSAFGCLDDGVIDDFYFLPFVSLCFPSVQQRVNTHFAIKETLGSFLASEDPKIFVVVCFTKTYTWQVSKFEHLLWWWASCKWRDIFNRSCALG